MTGCSLVTDEYQKDQRMVIAYLLEDLPLPDDSEIIKVVDIIEFNDNQKIKRIFAYKGN